MERHMNERDYANSTFVIGTVKLRERVEQIVEQLQQNGIAQSDISIISPDDREGRDPADEKPRANSDKAHDVTVGALTGGVAMGVLGCLVGLASLAIPGLGIFVVAGPLAAALGDAAVGGAIGAIAGSLIGLRVPEHRAKAYEESLRSGSTIISIHAEAMNDRRKAREILEAAEAGDICEVTENSRVLDSTILHQ
jgi:hypothetical protein